MENLDLAYQAWTIIANVSGGNWDNQSEEWVEAAIRWRDSFHATLDVERNKPVEVPHPVKVPRPRYTWYEDR